MKKSAGFTLVELMIFIAIVAILSAVAIPNIIGWLSNYRLRSAVNDLLSNMQLAKVTAIKTNSNCTVTFNQPVTIDGITSTYDYVVYEDSDNDLEYDAGEKILDRVKLSDYKDVSFNTAQGGGDGLTFANNDEARPSIAFRSNGLSRSNSGGFGAGTAFLKNTKGKTVSIVVSSAGNIRIQ